MPIGCQENKAKVYIEKRQLDRIIFLTFNNHSIIISYFSFGDEMRINKIINLIHKLCCEASSIAVSESKNDQSLAASIEPQQIASIHDSRDVEIKEPEVIFEDLLRGDSDISCKIEEINQLIAEKIKHKECSVRFTLKAKGKYSERKDYFPEVLK